MPLEPLKPLGIQLKTTDRADRLADLRRRANNARRFRQRKMAEDASSQAEEEFRYRISRQNIPPAETDPKFKGIFGETIGKVIPDVIEKPMSEGLRFGYNVGFKVLPEMFYAGATGITSPLGITGGEKAQRVRARLNEFSNDKTHETHGTFSSQNIDSMTDMFSDIKDIHEERGFLGQVGVSFFNPAEYLLGFGLGKGVKAVGIVGGKMTGGLGKAAKAAKEAGPQGGQLARTELKGIATMEVPTLPEPRNVLSRIFRTASPSKPTAESVASVVDDNVEARGLFRRIKDNLYENIGIYALADPTNRGIQINALNDILTKHATSNTWILVQRLNKKGDVHKLFGLDDSWTTNLGGRLKKRMSFQAIAQQADTLKYVTRRKMGPTGKMIDVTEKALNPEQMGWLNEFESIMGSVKQYVDDMGGFKGASRDSIMFDKNIQGRYWPNMWKFFEQLDVSTGKKTLQEISKPTGGKRIGSKPFWQNTRFHKNAVDAYDKGYRGDPMEQVTVAIQSMYKLVVDKQVTDMARPWLKTMKERMGTGFNKAVLDQTKRVDGLTNMKKIGLDKLWKPGRKRLGQFKGRTSVSRSHPEFIERINKIRAMTKKADKEDAINLLKKDMDKAIKAEADSLRIIKKAKTDATKRYAKRPGELSFPMSAFSGKIGTPKELIENFDGLNFAEIAGKHGNLTMKEFDQFKKLINRSETGGLITRMATETQTTARTLMSSLDFGVMGLHLLPMALTAPKIWGKAVGNGMKAVFDPETLPKYLDDNWDDVLEMAQNNMIDGALTDFIEGAGKHRLLRRATQGKVPTKVPLIGEKQILKPADVMLGAVQRQFTAALTVSKVEMYKALKPIALHSGKDRTEALHDLSTFIRKATGTGAMEEIGLSPGLERGLGAWLMFAPRYRLATYGIMKDMFKTKSLEGSLARSMMGRMAMSGLMYYSYIGHHINQAPNLDPTSSKFLTYKVGNSHIGIGSAYVSTSRFIFRNLGDTIKDVSEGRLPTTPLKFFDDDNVTKNFVRGQLAPLTGTAWDMIQGRDFIGEPTREDWGQVAESVIGENLLPFWASGMLFDQPRAGWISPPVEFMGGRTYPVSQWERYKHAFDIEALSDKELNPEGLSYSEMNKLKRAMILNKYPELQQLQQESYEISALREISGEVSAYRERTRVAKDYYDDQLNETMRLFQTGKIRAKRFREERSRLGSSLGFEYDLVEEQYADVIKKLDEERQNPRAHLEDLAYDAYINEVVEGDFYNEEIGEFDYAAKREAEAVFEQEWGEANYSYVKNRMNENKPPLLQELDLGREAIGPYWEVGNIILDRSGNSNLKAEYSRYLKARKDEREQMELTYPVFKEVRAAQSKARESMRLKNAKLEQFLFRWDYIDTLINPDNIGLDIHELKGEPIFFNNIPEIEKD